jgi:hypothetical protein
MAKKNAAATLPVLVNKDGAIVAGKEKGAKGKEKPAEGKEVKRVGDDVDLLAWLEENVKDGETRKELRAGEQKKDKDGRVVRIDSPSWSLEVGLAKRKVNSAYYEKEFADLLPKTALVAGPLVDDNLDYTVDDKGNELPSVMKYFRQSFSMLARNAAGASIAAQVEGPEKARERTIVNLMKHKGWSREKAEAKYELLMAD